ALLLPPFPTRRSSDLLQRPPPVVNLQNQLLRKLMKLTALISWMNGLLNGNGMRSLMKTASDSSLPRDQRTALVPALRLKKPRMRSEEHTSELQSRFEL